MAGYTSMAALKAAIMKEVFAATDETLDESFKDGKDELTGFYIQGSPINYERQYILEGTPRRTEAAMGGNTVSGEVYLDQGISYETGTYSGAKVIAEAERGGSGILGRSRFWERTEEKVPENRNRAFGKRFK